MPADPMEQLKSRGYVWILLLAAAIGAPVAVVAYFFLKLISYLQTLLFVHLPSIWVSGEPVWWRCRS